jgi:hypothetical protein
MNKPQDPETTRECITHHYACDCREASFAMARETHRNVMDWQDQSDAGLRLRCGELTDQEIRTVRAVLNAILRENLQTPES